MLSKKPLKRLKNKSKATENGCHLYTGSLLKTGYGQFWLDGKNVLAHRASYELNNGPIPKGLNICHSCDVRHCINPRHLFLGTQSDNIKDCYNKRRHPNCGRPTELTDENAKTYKQKWYVKNRDRLRKEGKMGFKYIRKCGGGHE